MIPGRPEPGAEDEAALRRVESAVRGARGLDLRQYKRAYLRRRLAVRQRALGLPELREYAACVARDVAEVDRLLHTLTINVTEFFRNPTLFALLQTRVLPGLLQAAQAGGRPLQIWSAGCASGDEAYSLALALHRMGAPPEAAQVLGTDVDGEAVAAARSGRVDAARLRELTPAERATYLEETADPRGLRVRCEILSPIRFQVHDLQAPPPRPRFDLILCRNVLIYFELELQEQLLERIAHCLRPGAVLALGRVERLIGRARDSFEPIDLRERVYRKISTGATDAN